MEHLDLVLLIATNLLWCGVAIWINRSWGNEYRKMNAEWSEFSCRILTAIKDEAKRR